MHKRLVTAIAMVATVIGLVVAPSPALAKSCSRGYVHGKIGGVQKCLRAGEYCAHRYSNQYHRYGFNCVLYRKSGTYRLKHRIALRVRVVRLPQTANADRRAGRPFDRRRLMVV